MGFRVKGQNYLHILGGIIVLRVARGGCIVIGGAGESTHPVNRNPKPKTPKPKTLDPH